MFLSGLIETDAIPSLAFTVDNRLSSLSAEGVNLSTVIRPARKQSLQYSFGQSYPIEPLTTFYKQNFLDIHHIESASRKSIQNCHEYQLSSDCNSLSMSCSNSGDVYPPLSFSMNSRASIESLMDPYVSTEAGMGSLYSTPRCDLSPSLASSAFKILEIPDSNRFSQVPEFNHSSNTQIVACNAGVQTMQESRFTSMDLVRSSLDSLTRGTELSSLGVLDLFPSPPSSSALARLPSSSNIRRRISREDFPGLDPDDCFGDWLQQFQDRFVARQSSISRKQVMQEFKGCILQSYNAMTLNDQRSLGIAAGPSEELQSLDFETYHGITNDMRQQVTRVYHYSRRPRSIDYDHHFSASVAAKQEKQWLKGAKFEEAKMCTLRDEMGQKTLFQDLIGHRHTLVVFLRSFGCAKSQEYVRRISSFFEPGTEARQELDQSRSTVVFIGTGSWQMIASHRGHKMSTIWKTMVKAAKSIPKLPLHHSAGSFSLLGGEFCFHNPWADQHMVSTSIVDKLPYKSVGSERGNLLIAHSMEVVESDPFRRSFVYDAHTSPLGTPSLAGVRCIYANRVKSSDSQRNFHDLFHSAGVQFPNSFVTKAVTIHTIESSSATNP
ncbi:hypothetical protein VP01_1292g8 [Puccinia sorghi]|uniref:Uncharacterized protein n=1 Tax=Puccinia sorghi TaxID=27349 RepID=A0A0L6VNQ4_9BASI|nr:hypothetical protein VP01_1292g8 [Puccinia sorghi]